jgi:hypothetical protein
MTLFLAQGGPPLDEELQELKLSSPSIRPPSMDCHPLQTLQADVPPALSVPGKLAWNLPSAF